MSKCKITIAKIISNMDLIEKYSTEEGKTTCHAFEEGQVFISDNPSKSPEGFCKWAWVDIQRDVMMIMYGADIPWFKKGTSVVTCSDGLTPVIFILERIDEGINNFT